ncbi:MAG: hypothetical protein U9R44_03460 [Candidatus Omnitrophota bacterium]|nr:hypothetical protein [Candidatus Omnitrophota bacterium]
MELKKNSFIILFFCLCALLSGCATTKHHYGYKLEGKEYKTFAELDDEHALMMIVMIFNVPAETFEDGVAKNITISRFMETLGKRKSAYLKNSGVFGLAHEKVELKNWNDDDLLAVYNALEPKVSAHYLKPVSELSDRENAARIVRLTGMSAVVSELRKRSNTRQAWNVLAQVLVVALNVALAAI